MQKYVHPQGATLIVYDDGSIAKFDKNGKATKTSATAEKLAKGHGGWILVEGEAVDFTQFNSDREAVPGGVVKIPMKFKSAPISDLDKYIIDPNYVMQQKIDGIRAQIVFGPGTPVWIRSNSGERLKSTASAPTVVAIEKGYRFVTFDSDFCVDGEIINGVFWAFDIVVSDTDFSMEDRLGLLESWLSLYSSDTVRLLPTAKTVTEKQNLVDKVIENNGEGFIVKHKDSLYAWGGRVDHSLKIKLVETVDCIVVSVSDTKDSISLGVHNNGSVVGIGSTSTIGKGTFLPGDVVEVQYLYAGSGGRLVQPTILKKRLDKQPEDCYIDQLKYVNKEVVV